MIHIRTQHPPTLLPSLGECEEIPWFLQGEHHPTGGAGRLTDVPWLLLISLTSVFRGCIIVA